MDTKYMGRVRQRGGDDAGEGDGEVRDVMPRELDLRRIKWDF
jgi:hypothetical protein